MITLELDEEEAFLLNELLADYVTDLEMANNREDSLGGDIDFLRDIIARISEGL